MYIKLLLTKIILKVFLPTISTLEKYNELRTRELQDEKNFEQPEQLKNENSLDLPFQPSRQHAIRHPPLVASTGLVSPIRRCQQRKPPARMRLFERPPRCGNDVKHNFHLFVEYV